MATPAALRVAPAPAPAADVAAILEALPAGVVVLNGAGQIVDINPAAIELLGNCSAGEAWFAVVQRAFEPRWDDGHDLSLADGRRVHVDTRPIADGRGQLVLITDVTETRALLDLVGQHRRLADNAAIAAGLAHQIRTPLATALLHLSGVARDGAASERSARGASHALAALRHIEKLVQDMLAYARGGSLELEPMALPDFIAGFGARWEVDRGSRHYRVEIETAPQVQIAVNRDALVSVMLNLVLNAEAACPHGRMRVGFEIDATWLRIGFHDDGPGIAPEIAERMFEPFFTTRPHGTGLGLPIARLTARAHGGEVELEDVAAGGCCLVLRLPIQAAIRPAVHEEAE